MVSCGRCDRPAVFTDELRNLSTIEWTYVHYCAGCFDDWVTERVYAALDGHRMIEPGDRVLLCVSGEKDSTVMMDIVHRWLADRDVHADVTVLAVDEGIGDYRTRCIELVRRHAQDRGFRFVAQDYRTEFGMSLDDINAAREPDGKRMCAYCCSLRGHTLRRIATELEIDKIATGMTLSDAVEYAFMCVLRGAFDGQSLPVYQPPSRTVRFVQPIHMLKGIECALYARLRGIEILNEDCTYFAEHVHDDLKHLLNLLEDQNPGIMARFYNGYVKLAGVDLRQPSRAVGA